MCVFGYAEEGKKFSENYPVFLAKLSNLNDTMNKVFKRVFDSRGPADGVIFHLGEICAAEDFCEILLLCQNGFGFGGLKLLRGLYERIVTIAYISKNPKEAEAFIGYNAIHRWKEIVHAEKGGIDIRKYISKDVIDDVERRYRAAKNNYQGHCKKCRSPYPLQSWSSLGIPSMAQGTNSYLPTLYYVCYFLPTVYGHATLYSIEQRLNITGKDKLDYVISDKSAQHEMVDTVLRNVHALMLVNLAIQNEFFCLKLDEELKARLDDLQECWGS